MLAVLAALLWQDPDIPRDQKRVRDMLARLGATMEAIREKSPQHAARLDQALKKLKADAPELVIAQALRELEKGNLENARRLGESVERTVAALLKILEDPIPEIEARIGAIRNLRELIGAFELRRKQREGTGRGGDGKPPLVPDIVQLSLISRLQEDLRRRTLAVEKGLRDLSEGEVAVLRRLSDEQDRLQAALKKYIEEFGRNQ